MMENDFSLNRIPSIREAYNNIHASLGDEIFEQYTCLLKYYLSAKLTKLKFDNDARKLLCSAEQIHLHNLLLLSLSIIRRGGSGQPKVECIDYGLAASPHEYSSDSPKEQLIRGRICLIAFEHGLDGADDAVADIILLAVQVFLKNIITAMASRSQGYKIRENNFQHAVGVPAVNPWLRNAANIIDSTQESNITMMLQNNDNGHQHTFQPFPANTLDTAQQQSAFAYSCSTTGNNQQQPKFTLKCLYETLLHDPYIITNQTVYQVNMERILSTLIK